MPTTWWPRCLARAATTRRQPCARRDALAAMVAQPEWSDVFTAYARCARITRSLPERLALNPAAYVEPVESELHARV